MDPKELERQQKALEDKESALGEERTQFDSDKQSFEEERKKFHNTKVDAAISGLTQAKKIKPEEVDTIRTFAEALGPDKPEALESYFAGYWNREGEVQAKEVKKATRTEEGSGPDVEKMDMGQRLDFEAEKICEKRGWDPTEYEKYCEALEEAREALEQEDEKFMEKYRGETMEERRRPDVPTNRTTFGSSDK